MIGFSDLPRRSAMYTLKQMEAFYWSAVLGSFSASAKKLHASQSAIAKRVAELEGFAGAPLFERGARVLTLTPRGRRMVEMAQEMLALNARIVQKMAAPDSFQGLVRLGATELVGLTWLANLIDQTARQHPQLQLMPDIDGGVTLYRRLEEGSLDVAIMPGPFWSYEYESVPMGHIRNVWMASPSLALGGHGQLAPRDLLAYPVITQPTNSALTHLYDGWFAEQGLSVKRVLTCNSLGVVAQLTMLGLGISYLPPSYFGPLVAAGHLRQLDVVPELPQVHYYAVYKKALFNPMVARVVELASEVCDFNMRGSAMAGLPSLLAPRPEAQ
ncbi:LysR family transcriptional regulator [Orrella sp. JC864]|uniref:LysR family transcriptional regulator n=1 Tax=Orrella sp. JC864 TaxID=3120298 RepID=UPI0012BD1E8B